MNRKRVFTGVAFLLAAGVLCVSAAPLVTARNSLDSTLPELKFDNVTLVDALDFLRDASGANLHVNWKALEEIGIAKESTINVRLRTVPLRKVLRLILNEAGNGNLLTYYIDDNVIEVTTTELADKDLITKIYPVGDLIMEIPDFDQEAPQFQIQQSSGGRGGGGGGGQSFSNVGTARSGQTDARGAQAQQLIDIIQTTIKPDVWNANGGPAAIRFFNGSLIITAPRSVHEALGAAN